jgi:hypothetical protein
MTMATISNVQRHPVRGGLYGLLLGLGVAIYLVLFSVTPFSLTTMALVVVVVIALGAAWGAFAPPKRSGDEPLPARAAGVGDPVPLDEPGPGVDVGGGV